MIDFEATQHNMRHVAIRRLAREEGLVSETLYKFVFDKNYPKDGRLSARMIEVLKKHGYLVETPEDSQAA